MRWVPFGDGFEAMLAAAAGDETRLLDDSRLSRGVREALARMGSNPRLAATALQTVGVKGYDGFAMAVVLP